MLKNLPIIPSQTSQNFYLLFYSHSTGADPEGGLWGLETPPFQEVSYS